MASIVSTTPANFSLDVIRNIYIQVKFDVPLDRTSITKYTVILVESVTEDPVQGSVDYVPATNAITFQLFDLLKRNTNYTLIVVGGVDGIQKLNPHAAALDGNYIFSFTTGETIDYDLPLASRSEYTDGPYFQGDAGVYRETFDRTGDTVSHIVTTSAQVSPSGLIVPAAWGADRYIPSSGTTPTGDIFALDHSDPVNNEVDVLTSQNISLTFNDDISSVGSFDVVVTDFLGLDRTDENTIANYNGVINGDTYTITPQVTTLTASAIYTITLHDVESANGQTIDDVTISFKTKIAPFYSTIRLIRNLGPLVEPETDETIALLIYENSIWIYETANEDVTNELSGFEIDAPPKEAKDYVACKTKLDLIYNRYLIGGQVTDKSLADLKISYGPALTQVISKKIAELEGCVNKNLAALNVQGKYVAPQTAVKANSDPRMPIKTTSWQRLISKDFI